MRTGGRTDYWDKPEEIFARAFDEWCTQRYFKMNKIDDDKKLQVLKDKVYDLPVGIPWKYYEPSEGDKKDYNMIDSIMKKLDIKEIIKALLKYMS